MPQWPMHGDFEEQFDRILEFLAAQGEPIDKLRSLKPQIIAFDEASRQPKELEATDFTFEEAVFLFGLRYDTHLDFSLSYSRRWEIEDDPATKGFEPSPCFLSLMINYSQNFDRSSKAACRTALHFILNECLTVMKGNNHDHTQSGNEAEAGERVPTPFDDITVFGQLSLSHTINTDPRRTIVSGRIDNVIGRVLPGRHNFTRRFESLLLAVEAKTASNLAAAALPELVVYLASIHQSRLSRGRSDASVYGFVSDGYVFEFVTITHDGTLRQSRRFSALGGDLPTILGCLRFVLAKSALASIGSPNVTDDGGSDPVDLDDNEYTRPPRDEDEGEDW